MLTIEQANQHLDWCVTTLRELVEIESPTTDKEATDRIGRYVSEHLRALGATVVRHPQEQVGDHWVGSWGTGSGGILMMVHLDTVHPLGTIDRFPWSQAGDRLSGPGIFDMKASAAMALAAIKALQIDDAMPERRISLLFNSDEETGSHSSRELIESLAGEHDLVLCLEPALPDGALKTWRKGIGMFELEVRGRPAHAGANPGDGVNAIHEIASQIQQLAALADNQAGTSINFGQIQGGTRTNVIPALALASIDVRFQSEPERQRIAQAFDSVHSANPEAEIVLTGEWNRPAMPRSETILQAFARAQELGAAIGLELSDGGTGGGSDANFVAPLGIPLLDGLGAVGGGAHTEMEFVKLGSLPERTALLGTLLTEW
jgi:glutamate carboxypeptidase